MYKNEKVMGFDFIYSAVISHYSSNSKKRVFQETVGKTVFVSKLDRRVNNITREKKQ